MKWQNTIAELLEDTPKSRLGWTGFSTLYSMFLVASEDDKTEMLESMRKLIEFAIKTRDEDRWRFAANIIYLSSFLGNTVQIFGPLISKITKIDHSEAPSIQARDAVDYACKSYQAANRDYMPIAQIIVDDSNQSEDVQLVKQQTQSEQSSEVNTEQAGTEATATTD